MGFAALTATAGVVAYMRYWDFGKRASELDALVQKYVEAGLPFTADNLAPKVDPSQNAAPLLEEATRLFGSNSIIKISTDLRTLCLDKKFAEMAAKLAPFNKGLDKAIEASRRGAIDFGIDYDQGTQTSLFDAQGPKAVVAGLCFRAEARFGLRQTEAAIKDWTAAKDIAHKLCNQPGMIGTSQGSGQYRFVLRSVCRSASVSSEPMPPAIQALVDETAPWTLDLMVRGEAYSMVATCRNMESIGVLGLASPDPVSVSEDKLIRQGVPSGTQQKAMLAAALDYWTKFYKAVTAHGEDMPALRKEISALTKAVEANSGLSNIMLQPMASVYEQGLYTNSLCMTDRVIAQTYLRALAAFRGGKTLTELPNDPYTGKPIGYKPTAKGFVLYSFGKDGNDDGGRAGYEDGDMVVTYPMAR